MRIYITHAELRGQKVTFIQAVFLGGVREVSFKSYFLSLVGYIFYFIMAVCSGFVER